MSSEKEIILQKILGNSYKNGPETLYSCPKCSHKKKKLSINVTKNVFKCWICDYSGTDITSLVSYYGRVYLSQWSALTRPDLSSSVSIIDMFSPPEKKKEIINLPQSFELVSNPGFKNTKVINYLKSRGLSSRDILKWKIGYCNTGEYAGRVIVPSFSSSGELNYFVARSADRKIWPKYKNPPVSKDIIFNELNINWRKPITLVEGVFDAIKVENSIPILGSSLKYGSQILNKISKHKVDVTVALDADAYDKGLKLYRTLSQFDIKVKFLNIKGERDLGDMGKQEVNELFTKATDINQDNYLLYEINKIK